MDSLIWLHAHRARKEFKSANNMQRLGGGGGNGIPRSCRQFSLYFFLLILLVRFCCLSSMQHALSKIWAAAFSRFNGEWRHDSPSTNSVPDFSAASSRSQFKSELVRRGPESPTRRPWSVSCVKIASKAWHYYYQCLCVRRGPDKFQLE